jgi:hypothetical protein
LGHLSGSSVEQETKYLKRTSRLLEFV